MTTWAELKTDLRVDLKDANSTKWSDDSLFVWTKDAVRDYSQYFPKRVDAEELTASDGTGLIYTLPTSFFEALTVECPADTFLEERWPSPGARYSSTAKPYLYHIDGGSLVLNGPPVSGDKVLLTYYSFHSLPSASDDDSFVLTVPDGDLELIKLYVYAKANWQLKGNQARLDRFKETGRRDDNPLIPEVTDPFDVYHQKLSERFRGGAVKLFRSYRIR